MNSFSPHDRLMFLVTTSAHFCTQQTHRKSVFQDRFPIHGSAARHGTGSGCDLGRTVGSLVPEIRESSVKPHTHSGRRRVCAQNSTFLFPVYGQTLLRRNYISGATSLTSVFCPFRCVGLKPGQLQRSDPNLIIAAMKFGSRFLMK